MASIQKRDDGKWRARYRDASHREHARHFSRKRDAEQWLASHEVAIARGEWVDPALSKIKYESASPSGKCAVAGVRPRAWSKSQYRRSAWTRSIHDHHRIRRPARRPRGPC